MKAVGLMFHAIRAPVAAQQLPGAAANAQRPLPLQVWPLREVCRALRVSLVVWPVVDPAVAATGTSPQQLREDAAKYRARARFPAADATDGGTLWPTGGPAAALQAAEEEEAEEEGR